MDEESVTDTGMAGALQRPAEEDGAGPPAFAGEWEDKRRRSSQQQRNLDEEAVIDTGMAGPLQMPTEEKIESLRLMMKELEEKKRQGQRVRSSGAIGEPAPNPDGGADVHEAQKPGFVWRPKPATPPAAPFPLDVLPRAMAEYAQAVAAALPCPVDFVAVAGLGAASVALGNSCHLEVKPGWHERPMLWLATVCETGAKKSPALAAATEPLWQAQRRRRRDFQAVWATYQQACAAVKPKTSPHSPVPRPTKPMLSQLLTTDATRGGLLGLLVANPRGLGLIADELPAWATRFRRDDLEFWLSLWSGSELLVNRVEDTDQPTAYLSHPLVSVMGCLPPGALGELTNKRHHDSGFADRLLFSWPEPVPCGWSEAVTDERVAGPYRVLFERLLALEAPLDDQTGHVRPAVIGWTPAGREAWVRYMRGLAADLNSRDLPAALRGAWAKMEGYGARIALILHVARFVMGETPHVNVDETSMDAAARLIGYFQAHARRVHAWCEGADGSQADRQAIVDWLKRHKAEISSRNPASFTWREIRRDLHNRFRREEDLRTVLEELAAGGCIEEVDFTMMPRQGRPPKAEYLVNPYFLAGL